MKMEIKEILALLPHRYPFLLVDRIEEVEPGKKAVGYQNVTNNEPFFQGDFPGHPIMPGVLIIEAMAQVGGAYVKKIAEGGMENKVTYFTGIDNARFRKPVLPGDILRMELTLVNSKRGIYIFEGKAYVGEALAAQAELKATFADA